MTRRKYRISIILFLVVGLIPMAFSDIPSLNDQIQDGIPTNKLQCRNSDHILVLRDNGNPACVSDKIVEKTKWKIIEKSLNESLPIESHNRLEINTEIENLDEKEISENSLNMYTDEFEQKTTNFLDDAVVEIDSSEITFVLYREIIYNDEGIGGIVASSSDDTLYYDIIDSDDKSIFGYYRDVADPDDLSTWSPLELRQFSYDRGYFQTTTNILSPGEYTAIIFNENTEIKEDFTIMDSKCCRPLSVSVKIPGAYMSGEEFQIFVKSTPNTELTFNLIDPYGKISKTKQITTNQKGTIDWKSLTISRIAPPGIWTLEVTDGKNSDFTPLIVIPTPDELIKKSPTAKEIQTSYDDALTNKEAEYGILLASSLEPFVDDGRERQIAILHRGGPPQLQYSQIMDSYNAGFDVNDKGVVTYVVTPHEKYSLNPKQGFYLEDWLPEQILDGQKLLYAGTSYDTEEINGNIYESYSAGYTFVPSYFVLHENVTQYDLYYKEGFTITIRYDDLQDEIDDVVEESKDRFAETYKGYGGYQEMMRDGKVVLAFDGGHYYDHEHARIFWIFDDKFSISLHSYYYTLDELIPIFKNIMSEIR